jgi:uncharacterized DUF497 family protein
MESIKFTWNPLKAQRNIQVHSIYFEEARTVFWDENGILISDPEHSLHEDRFLLIGMSSHSRLLVVVHCYRESETIIRLISARKATKQEATTYARRWL